MNFKLNRTGSILNRSERLNFNENWDKLEKVVKDRGLEILSEEWFIQYLETSGIKHLEEVATVSDLPENDSLNTVRGVADDNKIYIKKENGWLPFQTIDLSKINDVEYNLNSRGVSAFDYGVVSDGVTDNTDAIQAALNLLPKQSKLIIPPNTKWDYRVIEHPEDVTIIDDSTYDYNLNMWTGQQKIITNSSSPSTKNANEFIHQAPYHPAFVADITDDVGRTSFLHRRNGNGTWQEVSEKYGEDNLYSIKDLQPSDGTNVFQILGGTLANNEFGFNQIPSKGVSFIFKSKVKGNNINRFVSNSENDDTIHQIFKGKTESHRITFEATSGDIVFSNRVTGKEFKIKADGSIETATKIINKSPIGSESINYFGEEVYDSSSGVFFKAASNSGNTSWKPMTIREPRIVSVNPIGNVEIQYFGEEVYDSSTQKWYKSSANSGVNGWKPITN